MRDMLVFHVAFELKDNKKGVSFDGKTVIMGLSQIIYDPAANELLVKGLDSGIQELKAAIAKSDLDPKPTVILDRAERKVHKDLLNKKTGTLEVTVLVEDWSQDLLELLSKAGLAVTSSDQDGKTVTGEVDVKWLLRVAELDYVKEIRPQK